MLDQNAFHIGNEADPAADVLNVQNRQLSEKRTARKWSKDQCHAHLQMNH